MLIIKHQVTWVTSKIETSLITDNEVTNPMDSTDITDNSFNK